MTPPALRPQPTPGRLPPIAILQLALAITLLAVGWPVTKVAMQGGADPAWFALGRAALSMLVVAAALIAVRRLRVPARADLPALFALGLLQLGGFFAFTHAAIALVPAGQTAILANATLVWTVPIALLVSKEPISPRQWAAAALSVAGVVTLSGPWAIDWQAGILLGHAFLLGAALCWAVAMAVVRRWPPRLSVFALLPWAFAIASLVLLPLALAHDPGQWSAPSWICLLAIGLLMAPIGTWSLIEATAVLPLVVASVGFLAGPVLGLLLSAAWLHEPLTASVLGGAAFIVAAAALAARTPQATPSLLPTATANATRRRP